MTTPSFNQRAFNVYHRLANSGWSPRVRYQINRRLVWAIIAALTASATLLCLPLPERTRITGLLAPRPATTLTTERGGKIIRTNMAEGRKVGRGDILAEISPELTSFEDQRDIARIRRQIQFSEQLIANWRRDHDLSTLSLGSKTARIKQQRLWNASILHLEKVQLQRLQNNVKKIQDLGQPQLLSSFEWQRLRDPISRQAIRIAQSQVVQTVLKDDLEQAFVNLDRQGIQLQIKIIQQQDKQAQLEHELDQLRPQRRFVRAPWSGRIAVPFVHPGDLIAPGDKLVDILNESQPLTAEIVLTEQARTALKTGDTIELRPGASNVPAPGYIRAMIQKIRPLTVWPKYPNHLEQPGFEATVALPESLADSKGEAFLFVPGAPVYAWVTTGQSRLIERLYRIIRDRQDHRVAQG